MWVEFKMYYFISQKVNSKKVTVKLLSTGYFHPLSELLRWSHVTWDLPHVKFIGEKQTLLSYSVPRLPQSTIKPTFWCHQNQTECKLNRVWGCSVLPVGSTKVVLFTLDQVKTLFGYEREKKQATSTSAAVINPNINFISLFISLFIGQT